MSDERSRPQDRSIVFRQPVGKLECFWLHLVDGAWQWGPREGAEVFANYLEADAMAHKMRVETGDFCFAFVIENRTAARERKAADAAATALQSARQPSPQEVFRELESRHLA